jgi:DNA-binding NarL/FixJ family response regulator
MIKVALIDDHPMIFEGLKSLLSGNNDIHLASHAPNAFDGLQMIKDELPDVLLLDINLPDVNGIDLCSRIRKEFPDLKVIALSTFKERSYMTKMMAAGASGYMQKSVSALELAEGIRQVMKGKEFFDSESGKLYQAIKAESDKLPLITPRELEVLKLIAAGMTNIQIADKIFVSPLTVDSHRKNLIAKLGVNNTASLIRYASEHHLL